MPAIDRAELVDRITRLVLAELSGAPNATTAGRPGCARCDAWGPCPEHCAIEVRSAFEGGASRVSSSPGYCPPDDLGIRSRIDHTLLKPEATSDDIRQLCREAAENCFASVCVNPTYVPLCSELLRDTPVKVCTVVGFPLGAHLPEVKAYETRRAVQDGAREIDMVIDIGALKSKDHAKVERDIRAVVDACGPHVVSKVILEMTLLTTEEKVAGCSLAKAAGADFVKTSTGFAGGGATLEDVRLMREVVGSDMGIKAAGGIRTAKDAIRYLVLVNETAGGDWLHPDWFRFGASSLLNDLLMQRTKLTTGVYSGPDYFTLD
jgi:deoxyribose-phosphate aldolase